MEENINAVIENKELYNYSKILNRHKSGFDFSTLSDNELEIILTTITNEIQYTANGNGAFWGTMSIIIAMFLGMATILPNVGEKIFIFVVIVYLILVSVYFIYSSVSSAKRQKLLNYFRRVKDNKQ